MADNVAITAGSGTSIATDDVGGVQFQRVKLALGADGTATDVALGLAASASSMPVVLASDTSGPTGITTQNLVPAGAATAGSAVELVLNGASAIGIQVTGTYTGALSLQATINGTTWVTIGGTPLINLNTGAYSATIASTATGIFSAGVGGFARVRVTGLAAMTGTATVSIRGVQDASLVALDNSLPAGTAIIGA